MSKNNVYELINRIRGLRQRVPLGLTSAFWADFINTTTTLCLAEGAGVYLVSDVKGASVLIESCDPVDSQGKPTSQIVLDDDIMLRDLISRAMTNGFAVQQNPVALQSKFHWLCFRLLGDLPRCLILKIPEVNSSRLGDIVLRGQLISDIPQGIADASADSNPLSIDTAFSLLPVLPDIYAADSLSHAAYALSNGLVAHCPDIDLAVVGWRKDEYVRLQSISHFDGFEHKSDLAKFFEAALEEAADQYSVIHTSDPDSTVDMITLANDQLKRSLGCSDLASIVIFDGDGEPLGSVLIIKMKGDISKDIVKSTSFMLSLLSSRLKDLKRAEAGWFERAKYTAYKFFSKVMGKEWLWAKITTLLLIGVGLWLVYGSLSFRIESNGEFVTDSTQLVNAPQDGLISDVRVTVGDSVTAGQTLLSFEKEDLLLQLTELRAERQRYLSEEAKARADNNVIDTEIAKARGAQIEARLARVQLMLADTDISSSISGIIIEGERKDLRGAPVRKGDPLMKVARVEGIYLSLSVDERDAHLILPGDFGEFALVSQPLDPLKFEVEKIIPVAFTGSSQVGARFQVKARLLDGAENWWRPGMTGIAKIDKGDHAPYWVLGRKSYHQLRLILWW